jgi:hypothetical protein
MRTTRIVVTALIVAAASLTACSSGKQSHATAASGTHSSVRTSVTASPYGERRRIVIKTEFVEFDGKVVAGSLIGDSPFCSGGTLHHQTGSPEVGYPAINVFTFGPGPDQMNNGIQTSAWEVIGGSGDFAGVSGSGQMKVEFRSAGASRGTETFTGTVLVP